MISGLQPATGRQRHNSCCLADQALQGNRPEMAAVRAGVGVVASEIKRLFVHRQDSLGHHQIGVAGVMTHHHGTHRREGHASAQRFHEQTLFGCKSRQHRGAFNFEKLSFP